MFLDADWCDCEPIGQLAGDFSHDAVVVQPFPGLHDPHNGRFDQRLPVFFGLRVYRGVVKQLCAEE